MVMEKLSGASSSILWKIIFALITISFVLSGVAGYMLTRTDTSAVKINGEDISQQVFQQQYNDEYQRASQELGAKFSALADTPEFTRGLRMRVLNRLIDQELLRQYASELNLAVGDSQVKQQIVSSPIFQVDGKFDNGTYQQVLRNNNMTPDAYAEYVREGLRLSQLQAGLADTEFLVPVLQDEFVNLLFQQRKVRLSNLSLEEEMKKQTVTEQEIQDYYNANKAAFVMPETVKVQYIDLTQADVEKSVKVTDVEVAQYYQDHKEQFSSKGQQHLAHIEFATEKEAQDAHLALQGGADFAELAKTKSLDKPSAANGGDLGWVSAGDLPQAFEQAAAVLNVGQYSQPVQVDKRFHIVKLLDAKASTILPFETVKAQITEQIRRDLLNNRFYSVEKQVAEKAFEDQSSLKAAAEVAGVEVKETDYFPRTGVPDALNFPAVAMTIFDSEISQGGTNSEPMNVAEQHSIVVRVVDHKAESTRSLAEAKAEIEKDLKHKKAEAATLAQAEQYVKELRESEQPSVQVEFGEAQTWVYVEGRDPALNDVIFALPKPSDKPVYHAAKSNNGDVVIIALDSVEEGKPTEQERQQLDLQVAQAQQINLQNNLLKSLRARAKIEINDEFVQQEQE
ncbi:MAG TPA: peptidylprolyl isomerase [Pasteurellaceae bacterium]|nr:peptidylprolyl isomerase [Pasteurellaceae bacterium]